jgi:hypothetical protein
MSLGPTRGSCVSTVRFRQQGRDLGTCVLCITVLVSCGGCGSPSWRTKAQQVKAYVESMIGKSEKVPDSNEKAKAAIFRETTAEVVKMLSRMPPLRVRSRSPNDLVAIKAGRVSGSNARNTIEVPITFRLLKDIPEDGGIKVYSMARDKSVVGSESNYVRQMFLDASDGLKAGNTYTGTCKVAWDFKNPDGGGDLGSLEIEVITSSKR